MPRDKHEANSSDEERLFQIYKERIFLMINSINFLASIDLELCCKDALNDAKLIMQVFNERNLNEPTNQ